MKRISKENQKIKIKTALEKLKNKIKKFFNFQFQRKISVKNYYLLFRVTNYAEAFYMTF